MKRPPPRPTPLYSSAGSDVYKRQILSKRSHPARHIGAFSIANLLDTVHDKGPMKNQRAFGIHSALVAHRIAMGHAAFKQVGNGFDAGVRMRWHTATACLGELR